MPRTRATSHVWLPLTVCLAVFAALMAVTTPPVHAARKKADLTVTAVTAPSRASVGGTVTVKATVRNGGTAAAAGSVLAFKLSTDQSAGNDIALGTKATPRLKPRKSSSVSLTATIPAKVAPRSYYVLACADATRKVREKSEGNNCRVSGRVEVGGAPVQPRPDRPGRGVGEADQGTGSDLQGVRRLR